ncbi:hypothetical protein R1sor_023323 [Riccia sorocarpa]|uniref:Histone deacetylase interacting domain-containing protein n=1 Tax=Riccia sorocarpa TaxID=122646 RepID=A0ABD3GPG2_9MARC
MKRKRVEEAPMRLAKRVVSEHDEAVAAAEPQVVALMDANSRPRPDRQNGVAFLKMVKDTLKNEVERYDSFVKVMANYKRGVIGTREVIRRVKVLFKKHPNLILGFNIFLQPSDRIEVPAQDGVDVDVDKLKGALKFVNKVKVRFTSEEGVQVYRRFLGILRAFKVGMSVKEVYENIVTLFRGHEDLLVEFRDFLPARSIRNWVSLVASVVQKSALVPLPPPPSSLNQGSESSHRDPEPAQEEFPAQPPPRDNNNNNSKDKPGAQEQDKTTDKAPTDTSLKVPRKAGVEVEKAATIDASRRMPKKSGADVAKDAKKVDKPESNGAGAGAKLGGVEEDHENGEEKVRRKRQKRATSAAVQQKRRRRGYKKPDESEQLAFFESVSKEFEGGPVYKELFQSMNLCRRQIVTSPQLHKLISDVLKGHPHHRKAFHRCFPDDKDESDLLLQRWQTCTLSYQLDESVLSEQPAMSSDSEQEETGNKAPYSNKKILNKTWVTITTGGNAFTSQESNRYEEVLFQCEDDQYELDMLIETTRSTARKLTECIEMLKDSSLTQFNVSEHLSAVHLRCIERIYNPIYPTLLVHTRENPGMVLPVVLSRLEQRLEDWVSMRTHLNPLWAGVRAANHSKSLVYESDLEMEYVDGEEDEEGEEDEDDDDEYRLDSEDQDEVLEAAEYPVEDGEEAANEDQVEGGEVVGCQTEAQAQADEAEAEVEDGEKSASQDEAQDEDVVEDGEEVDPQEEEEALDAAETQEGGEEVVPQDEAQDSAEKGNESEEEEEEEVKDAAEVKTPTTKAEDGVGGAENDSSERISSDCLSNNIVALVKATSSRAL